MKPEELLRILAQAARLKTTTRHCYTEAGRKESVADHSWRIALMAMLMTGIEEYRDFDMNKVIRMCLIHDLGESFTGDIPTFVKKSADAKVEDELFMQWVESRHWTRLRRSSRTMNPISPLGCRWNMTCSLHMDRKT